MKKRWLAIFMHCRSIFQHIWPSLITSHHPASSKKYTVTWKYCPKFWFLSYFKILLRPFCIGLTLNCICYTWHKPKIFSYIFKTRNFNLKILSQVLRALRARVAKVRQWTIPNTNASVSSSRRFATQAETSIAQIP